MNGRVCVKCGQRSVHRAPRKTWEKVIARLTGARRDRCYGCGAREWVPDPLRGSLWQPLAVLAVLVGVVLLGRVIADPASRAPHDDAPLPPVIAASEAAATRTLQPANLSGSAPVGVSPAEASIPDDDLPSRPDESVNVAATAPASQEPPPQPQRHELRGVTPRWTGSAMEVRVETDATLETYSLIYVASSGGYVLDLPGVWQVSPTVVRSRSFTRSNLSSMDIGLHPKFLRLVFRTLQPEPAPRIRVDERGLRVLI